MSNKTRTYWHRLHVKHVQTDGSVLNSYQYLAELYDRIGGDNPRWRQHVHDGENASTNMVVTIRSSRILRYWDALFTYQLLPSGKQLTSTTEGAYISANWVAFNNLQLRNDVRSIAQRKVYKKLNELHHQFQGGVFLGEIVPTFKMLVRPFGTLRTGIKSYFDTLYRGRKRGRWTPSSLRRFLSDTWLEYAFGWQPLLADIQDASVALTRLLSRTVILPFKVSAGDDVSGPEAFSGPLQSLAGMFYSYRRRKVEECRYRFYGAFQPLPEAHEGIPLLERCIELSGFDLKSFVPTAWELIPYSFLVDYFTNVGDILQFYSLNTAEIKRLSSTETTVCHIFDSWDIDVARTKIWAGVQFVRYVGCGSCVRLTQKVITRTAQEVLGFPALTFNLGISAKQFANIGALLLGGHVPRPFY